MELYQNTIELIDNHLFRRLVPVILTLWLVELFFRRRFETQKALDLVCWLIIIYASVTWSFTLVGMALYPDEYAFTQRATGPYAVIFWLMFIGALVLPFTLFVKKWASHFWYVLLVAFGMKIGFYFERFVIIVTSLHLDYLPENGSSAVLNALFIPVGQSLLWGISIALLALGVFEIIKRKNPSR